MLEKRRDNKGEEIPDVMSNDKKWKRKNLLQELENVI